MCLLSAILYKKMSVMMWAAITHTGKTAVVHIPGNLTAQRYCDEILQPHVLPLMQQIGARFQHDNARPYTARINRNKQISSKAIFN
jgi:hypothetical protein